MGDGGFRGVNTNGQASCLCVGVGLSSRVFFFLSISTNIAIVMGLG